MGEETRVMLGEIDDLRKDCQQLQADNEKLKEFARYIIKTECWFLSEQDGGTIQDLAEKLGLIESCIATEQDVDAEFDDYEVGDTIYKFTKTLKG